MACSSLSSAEYDFISEPPKEFFCPVSLEIMKDPRQTNFCCGHHLSRGIADRLESEGKPCPVCNKQPLKTTEDLYFKRQVLAVDVRCSHLALGCEWVGKLGEVEQHRSASPEAGPGACEYVEVTCPFKCGTKVRRKFLNEHKSSECTKRPSSCEYCNYKSTFEDITIQHRQDCTKAPLECPNNCDVKIERCGLKRHLNEECPLQEVECEFSYAGCTQNVKRVKMEEHMDSSMQRHLFIVAKHGKYLAEKVENLSTTLGKAKKDVEDLSVALNLVKSSKEVAFVSPPVMNLKNFQQHKTNGTALNSSPFYTHNGGYKMCLHFKPNSGTGTHVGVYAKMMRGEFDEHLPWPFKGEVRVQLLNQCEGGESFERAVVERSHATRDGYSTALACVTMGVEPECWGLPYFISHDDLYKPEEGKEYLTNDTLKFKISVVAVHD